MHTTSRGSLPTGAVNDGSRPFNLTHAHYPVPLPPGGQSAQRTRTAAKPTSAGHAPRLGTTQSKGAGATPSCPYRSARHPP